MRLLCAAAAAVALLCGACARPLSRVEQGNRDGILHVGNGSEPETLDPNVAAAAVEATVCSALFEGLVNTAIDGRTLLPGVAERWEESADGLTYTFYLRSNARWSDGQPVTAEDFVYSFRRTADPRLGSRVVASGYAIAGVKQRSEGTLADAAALGVEARDAHTLILRLEHPAPYILYVLGQTPWYPVPRRVVEKYGDPLDRSSSWSRAGNLVGNGPYMLKSWVPNAVISVVRNPHYWDAASVRIPEIRFYPFDNPDAEEREFRAGGLHVTYRVPTSKIAAYAEDERGVFHATPLLATAFAVFNTHRKPFDNALVRRAFALAIDRDTLIPSVAKQAASAAHSLTRPGTGGYAPADAHDFDPTLARELLARAGFPGGQGLGRIDLLCRTAGLDSLIAEALQQSWRSELGAQVELTRMESKVAISTLFNHDFQVGLSGYFYLIDAPEYVLTLGQGGSAENLAGWRNPEFDRAYESAEHAAQRELRTAGFDTMERLIQEEAPYAPLYFYNQCQLVHPSLKGWQGNMLQAMDWRQLSLAP